MEKKKTGINRRLFLCQLPLFFAGGYALAASSNTGSGENNSLRLWDPFTPEETELIKRSGFSREIIQYARKKTSCAESLLMTSLKFLGKPDEWAGVAGGFGGGFGRGELCGLLTAGVMALGIAARIKHQERQAFLSDIKQKRDRYWQWWISRSPLYCREMRKQYDRQGYFRMIQRVAAKIEELTEYAPG